MFKVLIPEDISPAGKDYLLERGYELKVGVPTDIESLKREISDVDAIIVRNARYPKEVLEAGKHLKVIARHGTGVDNIAVQDAEDMGIWVVNGPTANVNSVAEYTLALLMALGCNLFKLDNFTRVGDWSYRLAMQRWEFSGKTAGIVGFGRIGQLVAEKLILGLGMKVIAYDPRTFSDLPEGVSLTNVLPPLLETSDFVTLHIPSLPETRGLFNYAAFSQMKKTAFFINCARGDVYIEADLVKALQEGIIRGAAVDVYAEEPRINSPLFQMDQVIVTQHNAGLSKESNDKMSLHAAIGVDEILRGDLPSWPVNHPSNSKQILQGEAK
jgi:D-3-phosphoglycerate dehydrogenase